LFFLEKKNQKTLGLWRPGPGKRTRHRPKVFCFFSSEKQTFLPHNQPRLTNSSAVSSNAARAMDTNWSASATLRI
jgi:hypothetical protein